MSVKIVEEHKDTAFNMVSALEDYTIGGHYGRQALSRVPIPPYPVAKAYIIMSVSLREPFNPMYRWKITVDDVALTREFRPTIERKLEDTIHAAFVYDITSAIKSYEPVIRVTYDGKEPIRIDTITVITIHRYQGFNTYLELNVDMSHITNKYSTTFNKPSFEANEHQLYLALLTQRPGTIKLVLDNDVERTHRLATGFNLIELSAATTSLEIVCEEGYTLKQLYNAYIAASTCYPDIRIESVNREDDKLKIVLRNLNNVLPDDVSFVVLRYGTVLYTSRIEPFAEELHLEIPLRDIRSPGIGKGTIYRVIWRKATRSFMKDYREL